MLICDPVSERVLRAPFLAFGAAAIGLATLGAWRAMLATRGIGCRATPRPGFYELVPLV